MHTKYNVQLNSPQLAYNINMKKYYSTVIQKNKIITYYFNNNQNYNKTSYNKTSYNRIYFPSKSISYP